MKQLKIDLCFLTPFAPLYLALFFSLTTLLTDFILLLFKNKVKKPKASWDSDSAASCSVLYPPLLRIFQITNFPQIYYGNWSFSNK